MARRFLGLALLLIAGCADAVPPVQGHFADVLLRADTETIVSRVPPRATLESLLKEHQLPGELVDAAVAAAREVFNPRHLRAERPYRLVLSVDGLLREFEYHIDADRFLRIVNRDRARPALLDAQVVPFEKETTVTAIRGWISEAAPSLIAAVTGTGEGLELALSLAEVFGGSIDFNNDLQRGDAFEVLFEKSRRDGEFAGYGAILAARFVAGGREHEAFRWTNPSTGRAGYYDSQGRSLRRLLLSSPLRFEPRITSRFSRSRFHPVHRSYRPHLGVDYGAPHGSAVVAVADGVVVSAGWSGGGGKTVHLRHAGGLETYYLHLSSFGKGIRRGVRVEQSQVVGRVGSTGTATGAHLDYRLRRNGVFVNPISVHRQQPAGEPIPSMHLATFRDTREAALQRFSTLLLAEGPTAAPDAVRAAAER